MTSPLKLLARDAQDVQVMAAVLQDAIISISEMVWRADDKVFLMVVQRFCWDSMPDLSIREKTANQDHPAMDIFERIHCALEIEGVESAQYMGLDPDKADSLLDLLTITSEGDSLTFIFAGGGKLRLKLENWLIRLRDFGESWPTTRCPRHLT